MSETSGVLRLLSSLQPDTMKSAAAMTQSLVAGSIFFKKFMEKFDFSPEIWEQEN
jgi:hypothetical protein